MVNACGLGCDSRGRGQRDGVGARLAPHSQVPNSALQSCESCESCNPSMQPAFVEYSKTHRGKTRKENFLKSEYSEAALEIVGGVKTEANHPEQKKLMAAEDTKDYFFPSCFQYFSNVFKD